MSAQAVIVPRDKVTDQVTQLLRQWNEGDTRAFEQLVPVVYDELRRLARNCLATRRQQSVIQPTVLVHEAWMKLANRKDLSVPSRAQFFALAAKIMRDLLVDHCRRQRTARCGGSQIDAPLSDTVPAAASRPLVDLLVLDSALNRLSTIKPRYAQIVELKFFAGLTIEESAAALQTSHATIEREWTVAKLWLQRELTK